ncbi:hypothetical protein PFI31113_03807 [Pandoraea fibrosis]|uniref:Uncharacterized protein n=1 Tax=Pandoraea fibrosis TaxID=1891094 RepID=A0A5E4XEL0_9BURK|nr:hypothetical protein PFI31113_03807 [Pandoraea fibrosis]
MGVDHDTQLAELRSGAAEALNKWRETTSTLRQSYTLETVKHLAFINGAGLAGAATALASIGGSAKLLPSLALFAFGLVFAVLDLYLNSLAFHRLERAISARINEIARAKSYGDLLILYRDPHEGDALFRWAAGIGWLSALGAVAGMGCLLGGLLLPPHPAPSGASAEESPRAAHQPTASTPASGLALPCQNYQGKPDPAARC